MTATQNTTGNGTEKDTVTKYAPEYAPDVTSRGAVLRRCAARAGTGAMSAVAGRTGTAWFATVPYSVPASAHGAAILSTLMPTLETYTVSTAGQTRIA